MAEVTQANVIAGLPEFTFRGLTPIPCASVETDGGHTQVPLAYPYLDVEGHDNTGRNARTFRVKLYFVNTVLPNAFPGLWNDWKDALADGTAGDCVHPIYGPLRARVLAESTPLIASVRAGIVVDVTFTETRDDPTATLEAAPIDLDIAADVATEECEAVGIEYPTGEGENTLGEDLDALSGAITSASMTVNGIANQVTGKLDNMFDQVEALTDPETWTAYDALATVYAGVLSLGKRIERLSPRATAKLVLQNADSLDAIAARVGNSDQEIMALNPALVRAPTVPKGATVIYYK